MKRHICSIVCALLIAATLLVFAGCGAHQHTYTDAWSVDAENHWHKASCTDGEDCAEAIASKTAHIDADNDKICDVCEYDYAHTHTFAETFSSDEKSHWYAASCGCSVEGEKGAHIDADNDGACDSCAYNGGHTHEFNKDAWAADEESHWYAATCSHNVKDSAEKHTFNDVDRCESCGYVKGGVKVENAVAIGEYYAALVNGGEIKIVSDSNGYVSDKTVKYTFGKDNVVYAIDDLSYDFLTQTVEYHSLYNGSLFSMIEEKDFEDKWLDARRFTPESASVIDGFAFQQVIEWDGDDSDNFYGVADLVAGLYEIAKSSDGFSELVLQCEGKDIYVFTFNTSVFEGYDYTTFQPTYYLYSFEVMFTLNKDGGFETVSVESIQRTCAPDETAAPADTTDAAKTYHIVGLVPTKVVKYEISQTFGERTAEAKFSPAALWATDWSLTDAEGNVITDTITTNVSKYTTIKLVAKAPETADISMDNIEVTCEGISFDNWYDGTLTFTAYTEGTYQVTIKTALKSMTYTVVVEPAKLESLDPFVMDGGWESYTTEYDAVADDTGKANVIFGAYPNQGASTELTATSDKGTVVKNDDGTFTLKDAAIGTYTVTLTATADTSVTATIVINVKEAGATATLSGVYDAMTQYGFAMFTLTFNDDGTVAVEDKNTYTTTTYNMVWDAYWLRYDLVALDGTVSGFSVGEDGLGGYVFMTGMTQLNLVAYVAPADPVYNNSYDSVDQKWGINFGEENTVVDYTTWASYVFTYEFANDQIFVTFTDSTAPFANAQWYYEPASEEIVIVGADFSETTFKKFSWG